ncbi:MAG: HK97 family phage prohead protease [Candidatus Humimicrobiaceae bacterium]
MKKERRFINFENFELRAEGDEKPTLVGRVSLFDNPATIGNFTEIFRKMAFSRAIKEKQDIRALKNHDVNLLLGRTKNGTLDLAEDDKGLLMKAIPPNTQTAKDTIEEVRGGYINEMSFAFSVPEGGEKWTTLEGKTVREIFDVNLFDVSVVTYPAYGKTSANVRNQEYRSAEEVYEEHLEELQADNSREQGNQARVSVLKEKLRILNKIKEY